MGNYDQQLINTVIEKVLSNYEIRPANNVTKKGKKQNKQAIEKIQAEIGQFFESEKGVIPQRNVPQNDRTSKRMNPKVPVSIKNVVQDQNDVNQVKTYINLQND
ncbi:hypothetical protein [Halalkalibacter nanhaiisediminis]|uniref:Uncharacterized protein n=1 Tax=Halalkalibacter nanhaiisediminis TaxID=688079 RepID=A0A562QM68_9BACI|nr:hypothetical protein [Halalkalibacter nanhaiisediminis]TWI57858.1 hypothetical protein IQ10_01187 [Halalkalibacter nanhaiisediminis]